MLLRSTFTFHYCTSTIKFANLFYFSSVWTLPRECMSELFTLRRATAWVSPTIVVISIQPYFGAKRNIRWCLAVCYGMGRNFLFQECLTTLVASRSLLVLFFLVQQQRKSYAITLCKIIYFFIQSFNNLALIKWKRESERHTARLEFIFARRHNKMLNWSTFVVQKKMLPFKFYCWE